MPAAKGQKKARAKAQASGTSRSPAISSTERRATWSLAFLEGFLSSWEYLLGLLAFGVAAKDLLQDLPYGEALAGAASTFLIMVWMLWRFGSTAGLPMKIVLRRMGVFKPVISRYAGIVLGIHIVSFIVTYIYQQHSGRVLFTLDNYFDAKTGGFRLEKAMDMLLLAPLREEFFFRGIMFSLIYRRLGSIEKNIWKSAVLMSGLSFASLHAINFFSPEEHSRIYVGMQVCSGLVIGWFYTLRFISTGCLWETICLHIIHNVFASLVPVDLNSSLLDLTFLLPAIATVLIHGFMARTTLTEVSSVGGFRYRVIDLTTDSASRLPAFVKKEDTSGSNGESKHLIQGSNLSSDTTGQKRKKEDEGAAGGLTKRISKKR